MCVCVVLSSSISESVCLEMIYAIHKALNFHLCPSPQHPLDGGVCDTLQFSSLKIGTSQEPETTTTTTSTTVNDEKIMATMRQHLSSSNTLLNRVTPRARSKHVKSAEFTLLR